MTDSNDPEKYQKTAGGRKNDDPFSELARIVGFDDDKDNSIDSEAEVMNSDGEFDLEAELMRELEIDGDDAPGFNLDEAASELPEVDVNTTGHDGRATTPGSTTVSSQTVKSVRSDASEAWPHASAQPARNVTSLEAELQAAFSALEGKGRAEPPAPATKSPAPVSLPPVSETPISAASVSPPPVYRAPSSAAAVSPAPVTQASDTQSMVPPAPVSPAPVYQAPVRQAPSPQAPSPEAPTPETPAPETPVRQAPSAPAPTQAMPVADDVPSAASKPAVPLMESEDLAGAFDRLQQDIDAAKPRSAAPAQGDITAALLAGLYESEKQPVETAPVEEEIPFDPSDISESDVLPEAMAELELTDFQDEEDFDSALQSDEFNLLLEDELADISEPQYAVDSGPQYEVGDEPEPVSNDDLDMDLDREMLPEDSDDAGFGAQIAAMGASTAVEGRDTGETLSTEYDLDDGDENYGNEYDEENFLDEGEFQDDDLSPPDYDSFDDFDNDNSGRRGLIAASIVLGIALVGGGGFYLWNSSLGSDGAADGPRVIVADSDPVKVKPENPGGKTVPNQDLAVYDKVSGNDTSASQDQNLITTTEEPVDVVQRTLDPDTLPLEGRGVDVVPLSKSEDRLRATADTEPAAAEVAANSVAPRKVRTLIVKPDGTIVAREDPTPAETQDGASQQAGVLESQAVGTDGALSSNLSSSLVGTSDSGAAQETALPAIEDNLQDSGSLPLPNVKPATGADENGDAGSEVAAVVGGNGSDLRTTMVAPVPSSRPADQPVNIVEAVTERGNLAGSETTSNAGGYVMQISSQPSEEDARKSYENLSRRYASIIGDKGVDIQRAVIPDRGIFYRVRILAGSKAEASDLCARYKSAGGSCFIAR